MSGNNAVHRFVIPLPSRFPTDDPVPVLMDSAPWWMTKPYLQPGSFIGSVVLRDSETAVGFIYLPVGVDSEKFYCTPVYDKSSNLLRFIVGDLKLNDESTQTKMQRFWELD